MKLLQINFVRKFIFYSLLCFYGVIAYWVLWPYEPIVIKEPMKIINQNKTVKAGGTLVYEMDFVKNMPLPGIITKQFIDGVVVTCAPIIGNIKVGHTVKNFPAKVPGFMNSGLTVMKWSATYKVNPIRWVTVVAWSEPFYVLNEQPDKEDN